MLKHLVIAVMSFTRIPLPHKWINFQTVDASKSMMFFPFTGAIIGGVCWLLWYLLHPILPHDLLAVIFIAVPIIMTGAYHEDGFADMCDSYGGYTRERMLEIMKDSRIGAYAGIGITLILLSKFVLLKDIKIELLPLAIMSAMVAGRFCIMLPFRFYPYVGHTKGTGYMSAFNWWTWLAALTITLILLFLVNGFTLGLFILFITQGVVLLMGVYCKRRYGGVTGDIGGAMEQVGEVVVYLLFMLMSYGTLSF